MEEYSKLLLVHSHIKVEFSESLVAVNNIIRLVLLNFKSVIVKFTEAYQFNNVLEYIKLRREANIKSSGDKSNQL